MNSVFGIASDGGTRNVRFGTASVWNPGRGSNAVIDRRAARTRRLLHEALLRLIVRKGFETLTVQDIIDEADVGRSTFYAHFTGKEALLRAGFEHLRVELAAARSAAGAASGSGGEPLAFSLAMFEHACAYKDIYAAMLSDRGGAIVLGEVRRVLSDMVKQELAAAQVAVDAPRDLLVQYVVGGFMAVLTWWLGRNAKPSPAELDAVFRRLVIGGIGPVIGRA
jgi:AcrR family transcriptional regulator